MNISILTGPGIVDSNVVGGVKGNQSPNFFSTDLTEFSERFHRSLSGWISRPQAVLNHYNEQRRALLSIAPTDIHYAIAALGKDHTLNLVTLNTDNLHERAGTTSVLHMQGTLMEARCDHPAHQCIKPLDYTTPMRKSDRCIHDRPYRPNVVLFEEEVSNYPHALTHLVKGDLMLCIGCYNNTPLVQVTVDEIQKTIPVHFLSNADALYALTNTSAKDSKLTL